MKTKPKHDFHVGQRFGELEIIALYCRTATVRCSCGREMVFNFSTLMKPNEGHRETCGARACRLALIAKKMAARDAALIGQRFGALVIHGTHRSTRYNGKTTYATVRCECGKVYDIDVSRISRREIRHCGCGSIYIDPMWKLALYTKWAA